MRQPALCTAVLLCALLFANVRQSQAQCGQHTTCTACRDGGCEFCLMTSFVATVPLDEGGACFDLANSCGGALWGTMQNFEAITTPAVKVVKTTTTTQCPSAAVDNPRSKFTVATMADCLAKKDAHGWCEYVVTDADGAETTGGECIPVPQVRRLEGSGEAAECTDISKMITTLKDTHTVTSTFITEMPTETPPTTSSATSRISTSLSLLATSSAVALMWSG